MGLFEQLLDSAEDAASIEANLRNLGEDPAQAVVEALVLALHGDGHASDLEQLALGDQIASLPCFARASAEQVQVAVARAGEAVRRALAQGGSARALDDAARAIGERLGSERVRETVFGMAAAAMFAEGTPAADEPRALGAIARAFDISDARSRRILAQQRAHSAA